jgi:hypothetical protein
MNQAQFKARAIDLNRASESPRSPMWPANSRSARNVPQVGPLLGTVLGAARTS